MITRVAPALFVLLWSTGFIGSKAGAPYAEPFTFLGIRFALVCAILFPICFFLNAEWPTGVKFRDAFIAGILIHGLYLGGVFWAIDNGMPAGVSAVIVSMQPILTAIVAGFMLNEDVTKAAWAGLFLGLVGVVLILAPKADLADAGINVATVFACVIALLGITFGTIHQKRTMSGVDLKTGAAVQFLGALAVVAPVALLFETGHVVWSVQFVGALAWLVIVLSIGAIGLLMMMINANAVSQVAALFYLVPAVTSLIAWVLFNETLGSVQLVGMALVTIAVMLVASNKQGTTR